MIDFSNTTLLNTSSGIIPLCASFDQDGKVTQSNQARRNVCVATRHGHFRLVVESSLMPLRRKISKWKIAVGSSIGVALGAFLLGLLLFTMLVNAKKKKRIEEIERIVYEEEVLQVSMVGHVRALTASATRTLPTIRRSRSPITDDKRRAAPDHLSDGGRSAHCSLLKMVSPEQKPNHPTAREGRRRTNSQTAARKSSS